ncbi:hypothetical protein ACJMK2_028909 [Sinanodonta woodiana]|uniref:UFSP1/2/DUB catalytic domain-containing protein n=1 Tax=Sinanodonta woodiana TaxID=1069815 RepID=A0ABD3X8J0_SINWO
MDVTSWTTGQGWGCGYRTLQSILSWAMHQQLMTVASKKGDNLNQSGVPSVPAIQEALVAMGDKPRTFIGSREWIGSFEVCLCLDYFHQVPCKILHVKSGAELDHYVDQIIKHFQTFGAPVMMGGDGDNSSKGILGVCEEPAALLVMDPHYYGNRPVSRLSLQEDGWIKWWTLDKFMEGSFYNLCFPQLEAPT